MEASTMSVQVNQEPTWDQKLVYYPGVNGRVGRIGRIFTTMLLFMLTAAPLWLLFLCLNQLRILAGLGSQYLDHQQLVADSSTPWQMVWCGVALLPVIWILGWFSATFAAHGIRKARGQ
jgi:hypothetical protein